MAKRKVDTRPLRVGVATIVVVAGTRTEAALDCLGGIADLDWPADLLDVVVVGSDSRLEERITERAPDARVVTIAAGASDIAARNAGAHAARGEFLAFLDVDCCPERTWLTAAVHGLRGDATSAAIASKVLDADGTVVFVDAGMTFSGQPLYPQAGKPDSPRYSQGEDVLFFSECAFVMETDAFRWVGGLDEDLCPGVEHADLGWRLWLAGFGVRFEPLSVVRRLPGAPAPSTATFQVGGLGAMLKNLDDSRVGNALAGGLLLADQAPGDGPPAKEWLFERLDALNEARAEVQELRQRGDDEITPLFREPMAAGPNAEHDVDLVRRVLGVDRVFSSRHTVLVVTPDVLKDRMAGPAIRAWHMAQALAMEHDVHLVTTARCELSHPDFPVRHVEDGDLQAEAGWAEVIIFQGHVMADHPWLRRSDRVLVADIYDPIHLEVLEQGRDLTGYSRRMSVRHAVETLNDQMTRGDFFLCASEKQRDFWLGQLSAIGRVNPSNYDRAENLEDLITIVPFGFDDRPPVTTRPVIKGVVPGIGKDDKVILWGGGVYNWFDPITLVHAVDRLRKRVPNVRLYFLGMQHPNPTQTAQQMAVNLKLLSESLELTNKYVFFNEGWVEYDDRQNYLLEADIGVSTHLDHVETAYSFRTRILDYLWADLPIVATAGDSFADVIEREGFGSTVPAGDVDALEAALYRLLTDDEFHASCRSAIAEHANNYRWSEVLAPILAFCRHPRRAPDLIDPRQRVLLGDPMAQAVWGRTGWKRTVRVFMSHLRHKEYDELSRKIRMRLKFALDPESFGAGTRL